MKVSFSQASLDSAGATLSIACAIHCIALPFVITILPLWGIGFLADESVGGRFLLSSLILATASLCWGFRQHQIWRAILLLIAGAMLICSGQFLFDEMYELPLSIGGAAFVATAHLVNRYLCNHCVSCKSTDH